jgi:hypothetical protein
VRVIFSEHFSDDTGGFLVSLAMGEPEWLLTQIVVNWVLHFWQRMADTADCGGTVGDGTLVAQYSTWLKKADLQ